MQWLFEVNWRTILFGTVIFCLDSWNFPSFFLFLEVPLVVTNVNTVRTTQKTMSIIHVRSTESFWHVKILHLLFITAILTTTTKTRPLFFSSEMLTLIDYYNEPFLRTLAITFIQNLKKSIENSTVSRKWVSYGN